MNLQQLQEVGEKLGLDHAVKDSYDALSTNLFELEESGPTALGPAVAVSISLASQLTDQKLSFAQTDLQM